MKYVYITRKSITVATLSTWAILCIFFVLVNELMNKIKKTRQVKMYFSDASFKHTFFFFKSRKSAIPVGRVLLYQTQLATQCLQGDILCLTNLFFVDGLIIARWVSHYLTLDVITASMKKRTRTRANTHALFMHIVVLFTVVDGLLLSCTVTYIGIHTMG